MTIRFLLDKCQQPTILRLKSSHNYTTHYLVQKTLGILAKIMTIGTLILRKFVKVQSSSCHVIINSLNEFEDNPDKTEQNYSKQARKLHQQITYLYTKRIFYCPKSQPDLDED